VAWLKLIRWKNLLIVFLTQLLAWFCVIRPLADYGGVRLLLNAPNFLLVSASTVLIAAAGYIINDYFDIKIDIINRPEKVVLDKQIPLKLAIIMHSVLNLVGLFFAFVVAEQAGHISWIAFQLACTVMLWFYSTSLKRQFMSGNVVVALLTAFTIIVLIWYEPALHDYALRNAFLETAKGTIPNPVWVLIVYTYFAFMLTWMREIVKDMEDFKGDAEEGCMTMPIKWGLLRSERFTQILGVLPLIPLVNGGIKLLLAGWYILGVYMLAAVAIPLVVWLFQLRKEATTRHYAKASKQIKYIMVAGIISLVVYYIEAHA